MIAELRHRDPLLFWTGALFMLALVVVTLISISDTRQILGLNPWIKPMKFLVSTTIFLWTIAWFMPDTEPKPAARAIVRWTIATAMVVEMFCVIMQSARGTQSHFNVRTPFDGIVFSVMGVMILFNTLAIMLFLWIIRRDTPPNRAGYIWGVRLGVAMFLVASPTAAPACRLSTGPPPTAISAWPTSSACTPCRHCHCWASSSTARAPARRVTSSSLLASYGWSSPAA
jgi:hypothetical protein